MKITRITLEKMKQAGEKIAMLTCYDASFASLLDAAGVDVLLVGDSLGMVLQGHTSTVPVTLHDMIYHTRCVARGAKRALVLADLPFGSYQQNREQAYASAVALMQAGAEMVKLEGGALMAETVAFLQMRGIPVCAHIGLLPQSVHTVGGYRLQGKTDSQAGQLLHDAQALAQAGAQILVLEMVPAELAERIAQTLTIPVIGIGAGRGADGQVLVLHDMLGIDASVKPRFVKNFMTHAGSVQHAVADYVQQVKSGDFPGPEHSY